MEGQGKGRAAARGALRAALGMVALCSAAVAPSPAPAAGVPVAVQDAQLVDAAGAPAVLYSTSAGGMAQGHGNTAPDSCGVSWRPPRSGLGGEIARAGFNSVRLGISWANLEPTAPSGGTHHWNTQYLAALDANVRQFTSAGLGVVISMHQSQWSPAFGGYHSGRNGNSPLICEGIGLPTWLYPNTPSGTKPDAAKCEFFQNNQRPGSPVKPIDGLIEAWKLIASRYASNPLVIGGDLLNEPGWGGSCHNPAGLLVSFFERVGGAVHVANPRLLLVVEDGTTQSYVTGGFNVPTKPNLPNLVYSFHYYPRDYTKTLVGKGRLSGRDILTAFIGQANRWGVPLWIGEFNAFNYGFTKVSSRTDPNWKADTLAMLALCKTSRTGWNFYAFDVGQGASLVDPRTHQPKPDLLGVLRAGM